MGSEMCIRDSFWYRPTRVVMEKGRYTVVVVVAAAAAVVVVVCLFVLVAPFFVNITEDGGGDDDDGAVYSQARRGGAENEVDGENWLKTIDDTPATPLRHYQLDGLKPDTQYTLLVRAHNGLGWSDYSQQFMFRTAPGSSPVVSRPPQPELGESAQYLFIGLGAPINRKAVNLAVTNGSPRTPLR